VKSFNAQQGYGFVSCEDTFGQYQRDVFLDNRQVPSPADGQSDFSLPIGQMVEFEVVENKHGHPQARQITWNPLCWMRPNLSSEKKSSEFDGPDLILNSHIDANPKTMPKLRQLSRLINEQQEGEAILRAMHCIKVDVHQTGEHIDLLSYALERIRQTSCPTRICQKLDQFMQMLLILSINRTLKTLRGPMTNQKEMLHMWLEAGSRTIDPTDAKVHAHFDKLVKEIGDNLLQQSETAPAKAKLKRTRIVQVLWEKQWARREDALPKAWARPKP
jgi:cold shock CspA family protein